MAHEQSLGRVKACTQCRQQKVVILYDRPTLRVDTWQLRCDAPSHHPSPCSRCQKRHLDCVVTRSFKKIKRQTWDFRGPSCPAIG